MDTALESIQAKIAELEIKIAHLKIAERELLDLDTASIRKTSSNKTSSTKTKVLPQVSVNRKIKTDAKPSVSKSDADSVKQPTISAAITDVLLHHDALSASAIATQIVATGRDINNRAISFALQAMKKRGLVKRVAGEWSLGKARTKRKS